MDVEVAQWLVSVEAQIWLERASAEADPSSLAAATRLRRGLPPQRAAAVLDQVVLRRLALRKLGEWAQRLFLTRTGLEMATRPDVARWRASRLVDAGVADVVDVGTGLGIDSSAFQAAGLRVRGLEGDPVTAVLATANLGLAVECRMVEDLVEFTPGAGQALFLDPSRRTDAGPTWDLERLSPPWSQVRAALDGLTGAGVTANPSAASGAASVDSATSPGSANRSAAPGLASLNSATSPGSAKGVVVAKLGPGTPHRQIPATVSATWVSHHGDLVELSLWRGPWPAGQRAAVLLPAGQVVAADRPLPPAGRLGTHLFEPDPAIIRAGAAGVLAEQLEAHPVADNIAYLTGDRAGQTPLATSFEIIEVMPFNDKAVRAWIRSHGIGALEIKTRGLGLDPAQWRRRLNLKGPNQATVVATPTTTGAAVLVVRRVV